MNNLILDTLVTDLAFPRRCYVTYPVWETFFRAKVLKDNGGNFDTANEDFNAKYSLCEISGDRTKDNFDTMLLQPDSAATELEVKHYSYCYDLQDFVLTDDQIADGWEELNGKDCPAEQMIKTMVPSRVTQPKLFRNTKRKTIIFLSSNGQLTTSYCDKIIMSLLPRIAPWIFPNFSQEEKEITMQIYQSSPGIVPDKLIESCSAVLPPREVLDSLYKNKMIEKWAHSVASNGKIVAEDNLRQSKQKLESIMSSFKTAKETYDLAYETYSAMLAQDISSLKQNIIDAFRSRKNIKIIFFGDREIIIEIVATLCNYDIDDFVEKVNNTGSYLYNKGQRVVDFLKAIFEDQKGELLVKSQFTMFPNNNYRPVQGICSEDAYPNPHLNHYACQGGYEDMVRDAFKRYDIEAVLDTLVSETTNINWNDGAVGEKMVRDMRDWIASQNKFIVPIVDGKKLTDEKGEYVAVDYNEFEQKYMKGATDEQVTESTES